MKLHTPPAPSPPSGEEGFILIFDYRFLFHDLPSPLRLRGECPDCHEVAELVEKQPYRQFVLTFVPLWKVKLTPTCLECSSCHGRFDVPEELRPSPPLSSEEAGLPGPGW